MQKLLRSVGRGHLLPQLVKAQATLAILSRASYTDFLNFFDIGLAVADAIKTALEATFLCFILPYRAGHFTLKPDVSSLGCTLSTGAVAKSSMHCTHPTNQMHGAFLC